MDAVVYKLINTANGKIYIGSTINLRRRLNAHKNQRKFLVGRAIEKYGWDSFEVEILEHIKNINILLEREQYWIDTLNPLNREMGYNICEVAGATYGRKWSPEQRRKIMESRKRNKEFGKWNTGKNAWNKGKSWDDTVRRKISDAKRGKTTGANNHRSIPCVFHHPQHGEHAVESINGFCKEFDLNVSAMSEVRRGLRKTHKKWRYLRDI